MVRGFLLSIIVVLFSACDSGHQFTTLPANASVVVLGDSLTYGTGAGDGEDYVSLLTADTGWNIINAGVPGNTSADGLSRLDALLASHDDGIQKIDLLIVELGGNDFLKHVPETETVRNLNAILAQSKVRNIQTVLIAIPKFSPIGAAFGNLQDHPLYEKLADETETPLIEGVFSAVLAKNSLKADPIHPNANGYRIVAADLKSALSDFGFLKN
ncbi:MAG: GDSL-type esterase/lipase family protein [Methylotenera sp.]|uniref:GDSL-type esterase/lipase family protein n=1 Tax=Methylotenera sp. TaxID=2051956 RepID=UPI002716F8B5|nr:GDSL-type esterase/lipase family protein [Methylotenera sp.]MDO9150376.1 GDSL-type esterase/lipase family protein [Methylotenera sp.]